MSFQKSLKLIHELDSAVLELPGYLLEMVLVRNGRILVSIGTTWALVRNAESQALSQTII